MVRLAGLTLRRARDAAEDVLLYAGLLGAGGLEVRLRFATHGVTSFRKVVDGTTTKSQII